MRDSKGTKREFSKELQPESTSDKTLADLEEEEKIEKSSNDNQGDVPSPDAEPLGHRDKRNDAGPM